jgi:small-conductance mechanosensitive channel
MIKYLLLILPFFSQAESDVFKRELDFVSSQRQTLEKQLATIKTKKAKKNADLDRQLDELHKEKARLTSELESTENEAAEYSRLAKKQSQSQSALTDRMEWIKSKNEEMIYFMPTTPKSSSDVSDKTLVGALNAQAHAIESMSQTFTAVKSYTDPNQTLQEGNVFHLGPFVRFLDRNNKWTVLSLTDAGYYSETNESSFDKVSSDSPFVTAAFIQLPFIKMQPILKEKNLFNRVMDVLPAVFLALVFFAIGWIFIQLAKS